MSSAISQPRTGGITLAAVVLSLMTIFGAVFLLGAAALLFVRVPLIPRIPAVRLGIAGFDGVLLLFLLWCVWTVAGLFRRRPSARISMLFIGALDLIVFALFSTLMLLARGTPLVTGLDAHPDPSIPVPIGGTLLALALLYGALAMIGLWWLIYFNLRTVRLAFHPSPAIDTPESAG